MLAFTRAPKELTRILKHSKEISVGMPREFIGISRHSKGILLRIQWNSKAYQKGIHYSRHCKGIHRNLKAFQREFTIIGIPREFIWIPRHSRGILLRIRMESMRIPRHSQKVFTIVGIVSEFIEISRHSKGHFAS